MVTLCELLLQADWAIPLHDDIVIRFEQEAPYECNGKPDATTWIFKCVAPGQNLS